MSRLTKQKVNTLYRVSTKTLIILALFALGQHFYGRDVVYGLADPTTIVIEQTRRYTNVGVSGDALFIVHYNLQYTVAPSESITEGWIGRLLDVGGAGQLGSVAPYAQDTIPLEGYHHGIFSFYFTTAPVPTGTLTVSLAGNPSLSPTPTGITSTSIEDRANTDLAADVRGLGLHLETLWQQVVAATDVITFVGGPGRFTADGENYFVGAIPGLATFAPDVFSLGFISADPEAHIDTVDTTFQTGRQALWANTPVRTATQGIANMTRMPRTGVEIVLILVLAGVFAFVVYQKTQQQEIGIFVALLWINVAAVMGFGTMALPYTIAFTAVFVFAYLLFFRPSAA